MADMLDINNTEDEQSTDMTKLDENQAGYTSEQIQDEPIKSDAVDEFSVSEDEQTNTEEENVSASKMTSDNTEDNSLSYDSNIENKKKDNGERGIDFIFDILELFIFSLAAVLILTTFLFRHSVVDGNSMQNTLQDGEHLIISDLFYTPKRGDIIVCEDYSALRKPIVKRIIAVEGDSVEVRADYSVYVNGELLEEDYVYIDIMLPLQEIYIEEIPEGEVFVMGDHRNQSTDSRDFGTVDVDSILGRVILRFYPFNQFGKVE